MRLLKPNWVSHEGKPIFSVDIHPDGSRFATGGQGDDSGKVVIWNMAPVKNEEDEINENVPRMLCHMDNHLGCVNSVRWSNNGKYLASGGDDKLIMIWQMGRGYLLPSSSFSSGANKINIEQWRCVNTLRGHSGDVLDLAWSPDDMYLASGSVDNSVMIWDAQRFPEVITVIKGHVGLVKGVTWDPVGKYLATQADDRSLKIWRTADWQLEATVSEPFSECSGTTHILRLGWSPDGHYVVSAHAMNNRGPVAKILERDGWKTRMDFVGHRKAVTCVRFNPRLFVKKVNGDSSRLKQYSCCAIGSRDRSLSIWLTALKRPLVVTHDIFNHSIMDIAWSESGFQLLVCSWDGTVAYADFTPEELGRAMTDDEKEKFHKQVYGISITSSKSNFATSVIENPEMLQIQQRHIMKQQSTANSNRPDAPPPPLVPADTPTKGSPPTDGSTPRRLSSSGGSCMSSPYKTSPNEKVNVLEKQVETRTKDGRRRITPLMVTPMDLSDSPAPFGRSSSSQPPSQSPVAQQSEQQPTDVLSTTSQAMTALASRIGKNPSKGFSDKPKEHKHPEKKETSAVRAVFSPPRPVTTSAASTPAASTTSSTLSVKRKAETSSTPSKRSRKDKDSSSGSKPSSGSSSSKHREDKTTDQDDSSDFAGHARHAVTIPYPSPERTLTVQIRGAGGEPGITLDLENNMSPQGPRIHVLKCSRGGKGLWETIVSSRGIALAGNRLVACVACENKSVCIFTSSGRKALPTLVLDMPASILQCNGHYVMVVTSSGRVNVWDTKKASAVLRNESVLPILSGADVSISRASISDRGYPVITLSTQSSYSFDAALGAWVQLVCADDPLMLNSDHKTVAQSQESFQASGRLAQLQGQHTRFSRHSSRLFNSNPGRRQVGTVVHLENQLSACLVLGSASEYRFWLMTYVRYLVHAGFESRLRELCEDLLGPPRRVSLQDKSSTWNPSILGNPKREMLREILPFIGTNIRLQRLFTEYKEQLDALSVR